VTLLDPFLHLTRILSGSTYVTSSIILPGVSKLIEVLSNFKSKNEHEFMETLAKSLAKDLAARSKAYFKNPLLLAATYMDPRYRKFSFVNEAPERDAMLFKAFQYIKTIFLKK
jgi:hypothetical protein